MEAAVNRVTYALQYLAGNATCTIRCVSVLRGRTNRFYGQPFREIRSNIVRPGRMPFEGNGRIHKIHRGSQSRFDLRLSGDLPDVDSKENRRIDATKVCDIPGIYFAIQKLENYQLFLLTIYFFSDDEQPKPRRTDRTHEATR